MLVTTWEIIGSTNNYKLYFSNSIMQKENAQQSQIHKLLFSRELGWQEIIYDLINTEQLDPWNINITILTEKYLGQIQQMEEADFFISSKVLLAASLLLRIKSEMLLNRYIKSIDEILFGREEKRKYSPERIELDEEIPELIPRSPIPRFRKVTLKELIESLNKAISTENRRIKKAIINRNALRETGISLPKKRFNIKNKIRLLYDNLILHFEKNNNNQKISFTEFIGKGREDRIISLAPLLHLDYQKKVWLEQKEHFGEIDIWLKDAYFEHNPNVFWDLRDEEVEKELGEIERVGDLQDDESEKGMEKS